ncbi:hypothetical protein [Neomoorella mulderi]|uniref:hypothetical protein n=1 Tax=Neomoorella mulderi TaxID=202604 RepID=UPI0013732FBA|nr:hypothetical protein [Moorella mulderi]
MTEAGDHALSRLIGKDLLLLLLYAPGKTGEYCEKIEGRTLLQKMVFLFEKEVYKKFRYDQLIEEKDLPNFKAYYYGPFSKQVFDDLDFLIRLGFIEATISNEEVEEGEEDEYQLWEEQTGLEEDLGIEDGLFEFKKEAYTLTKIGRAFVEQELWPQLSENQQQALASFKRNCTEVNLKAILRYVYQRYPETTENSKIKGEVLGNAYPY